MSLIAVGTSIATKELGSLVGKLFSGGNGGPNIARSLSKQVGFTVLQSDAATVRARLAAGLDPRTGRPVSNRTAIADQNVPKTGSIFEFAKNLMKGSASSFISGKDVHLGTTTPATGAPPPLVRSILTEALPTISQKVLKTPALPARDIPMRKMVPPTPPGGGNVSLLPAAGMAGIGAVARMGGRGLMRTTTGRISRILLPSGQAFSRKDAASLIRRVGFEAAAIALGITVVEAAEILLTDSKSRRRGRGITAAQVRNARRTTCAVARLARDLGVKAAPVRRRKTSCR